jgi:hypothetical protein
VTNTTKNLNFFETKTTLTPEIISTVKIEAKTMDQIVLVGDSHAGGIK